MLEKPESSHVVYSPGDILHLPLGTYHVLDYRMEREDTGGNLWRLSAWSNRDVQPVTVGKEATSLRMGGPFVPTAVPRRLSNGMIRFGFKLQGIGNESVSVRCIRWTSTASRRNAGPFSGAPRYTIVTSAGDVLAQGTFSSG